MGDRYVIPDETEKIYFMDATDFYDHSISQILPFDGIEMWHGHPDLSYELERTHNKYTR